MMVSKSLLNFDLLKKVSKMLGTNKQLYWYKVDPFIFTMVKPIEHIVGLTDGV